MEGIRALARLLANHCIFPALRHWLFRVSGIAVEKSAYVNMGLVAVDSYRKGLIVIEAEAAISPNVTLVAVSYPNDSFIGARYDIGKEAKVTIKRGAWLGANAVVLPGVTIGIGAVVGAGAVVTKDVSDYAIVVGVPARQIGDVRDKLRKSKPSDHI